MIYERREMTSQPRQFYEESNEIEQSEKLLTQERNLTKPWIRPQN